MINKFLTRLLLPVWTIVAFAAGIMLCLALTKKLTPSGWAETISAIATAIALVLAVVTFRSWQHQKIRDDAYSTTRIYISTLVDIETTQIEISNLLYSVIPAPGMIVLSDESIQRILNSIQEKHSDLRFSTLKLISTKNELPFWGVALSDKARTEHDVLMEAIGGYLSSVHYLHNSLKNTFIYKKPDDTTPSWQQQVDDYTAKLIQSFKNRKSQTAKQMFLF